MFPELDKGRNGDSLEARFNAFKIPESNFLVFEATVRTCRDGCQPVSIYFKAIEQAVAMMENSYRHLQNCHWPRNSHNYVGCIPQRKVSLVWHHTPSERRNVVKVPTKIIVVV